MGIPSEKDGLKEIGGWKLKPMTKTEILFRLIDLKTEVFPMTGNRDNSDSTRE